MRIIAKKTLRVFWNREARAKTPLEAWYAETKHADWKSSADVKAKYGSASILKCNRVVFNIAGNTYRLIVAINYEMGIVYIRFLGTHAEYNKIDAETV